MKLAFAGETWDGGGASDNWSSAENWNPNGAPANDGTANVTFAGSVRTAPILDTSFSVASLTFNSPAAGFVLGSSNASVLSVGGSGGITSNASAGNMVVQGSLRLGGVATPINVSKGTTANGIDLEISALISESAPNCGFVKNGAGTLKLSPATASSYTGAVVVNQGIVLLASGDTNDDGAIRGDLVIGDGIGGALADVVRDLGHGQIVETEGHTVTINSSGMLDCNHFNEAVYDLAMNGGKVTAGGGSFEVDGNAVVNAATIDSGTSGDLMFGGDSALTGSTLIIGSGGNLHTFGDASFSNSNISVGGNASAYLFGQVTMTGASVSIASGGTFDLNWDLITNASSTTTTITGAGTFSAFVSTITVADGPAAIDLDITARLDSAILTKDGPGSMRLAGANGRADIVELAAGTLLIGINSAIGPAEITFSGGILSPSGGSRSLSNAITAEDAPAILDTPAGLDLTLSGAISGSGGVTKLNSGTLFLSGPNTYAGNTIIAGGKVSVSSNGNLGDAASAVVLNGGTLRTAAAISAPTRNVIVNATGGTIDSNGFNSTLGVVEGPGTISKAGTGKVTVTHIRTGGLSLAGGTLAVSGGGGDDGTSRVGSIAITAGALDLVDAHLIVTAAGGAGTWSGTHYTGVTGLVASGYNAGTWNGVGIITSQSSAIIPNVLTTLAVANADETGYAGGRFGGVSVSSGDALVMYTWGADANLDGTLNGDDYFQIDSHFNQDGLVFGYFNGDFNYDGAINGDDYFVLDSNWNAGSTLTPFPTGSGIAGIAAVPEPTVGALMVLGVGMLSRRRRYPLVGATRGGLPGRSIRSIATP